MSEETKDVKTAEQKTEGLALVLVKEVQQLTCSLVYKPISLIIGSIPSLMTLVRIAG